jgi:hypothetical protein
MAMDQIPQDAAVDALEQAAQALAISTAKMQEAVLLMRSQGDVPGTSALPAAAGEIDHSADDATRSKTPVPVANQSGSQEAARFYERLEQTGQLMDVDDKTDLSTLPSRVTHVRRADGSVHRIGFSASPISME